MEKNSEMKAQIENTKETVPETDEDIMSENTENQAKKKPDGHNLAFAFVMTAAVGMAIGAGGLYLTKKKQIEFADRYSLMLDTEEYMEKEAEIGKPKNPNDAQIINAYLSLYGDEYTYYNKTDIKSKEYIIANVNSSVSAYCTGFKLDFNDENKLYFSSVTEDMPAAQQGIEKGDVILAVDGIEISEYEDAKLLKASDEKTVNLLINHNGEEKNIDFTLYPAVNEATESVTYKKYDDVLYIDYNYVDFGNDYVFNNVLTNSQYDSIIIDLRNNPGGSSDVILYTADVFVDKGEIFYHSVSEGDYTLKATDGKVTDVPIVLLVNEETASAAEIFTALLKQNANATIVGTTTYGKGIFQASGIFKKGQINYTDGYFTVGDWECWQGKGIAPDIEVKMDSSLIGTEDDVQLEKAIELLS